MPLTQKQMEYLALAWQCFDSEPKIDYEKFKTVAGLASAASARELMRVTKNKLKTEYGALSGSMQSSNATNGTPAKTPRSTGGGGKRKKSQAEMEDDDDDEETKTPSKKARKSPAKKNGTASPVKKEKSAESEGEDGEMV